MSGARGAPASSAFASEIKKEEPMHKASPPLVAEPMHAMKEEKKETFPPVSAPREEAP